MKRHFTNLLLLPLVALTLVACNSGSSGDAAPAPTTELGVLEDETAPILTTYDGAYQTFCGVSVFAPLSNTAVTVTMIEGDTGSITIFNYEDRGCTIPASPSQTFMELSLAYPGGTIDTDRGEADFIDITVESVQLDRQAPTLEEQQQLSLSSILGTRHDILVLQDSALYFGENTEDFDGTTPDTRPVNLSHLCSTQRLATIDR